MLSSLATPPTPAMPPPCDGLMRDSTTVWTSLGPSAADTPPPEEVTEEFFHNTTTTTTSCSTTTHGSQLDLDLNPVSDTETPVVAVIGVGYVGLHLVTTFAAASFAVLAYDVSAKRLAALAADVLTPDAYPSVALTSTPADLRRATHFLVAVPTTLLLPDKRVDTSFVRAALATVGTYARPGATVVVESSVGVGMTRRLLGNLMRSRNLKAGMSPERVDPGRQSPPVSHIPKLISGLDDITPGSLASIHTLYAAAFGHVVAVSSPEVAEMTKLYENCQRMVNIAYANEMADACAGLGIDAHEVAAAAATKPFGFAPYAPGLGVGGHCIPVNPYYLLESCEFPLLRHAAEKMWRRPAEVGERAMREVCGRKGEGEGIKGAWPAAVLVVGVGFKPGQSVLSCSPGIALMKYLLQEWDVEVVFADPLVGEEQVPFAPRLDVEREWSVEGLGRFDLIVVAIRQHGLDFRVLGELGENVMVKWCCA
ncbi:udp-glucose dehydrogenase udp-mannac [Diplodia corticola]|uniref:Udp-glucose dehydrogenase udp-mannac n=1 Tax=Diplodia corticola TaxID=236234 RepID=A0A1J9QWQ4_9PEZI|nr:udp-glucose dehydrogenase udp-mannac [Diplodia corticola]OJD32817.1 udp-glucose dehydrogenase udp-mannac [Diplodia corticola]